MSKVRAPADDALARIHDVVGAKGWIIDDAGMAPYVVDSRELYHGNCAAVVRPASREEVMGVIRLCAEARISVVPQGGNTGLVGGSVPPAEGGGIVLSLGRMNRIRDLDALNNTMTVEAGCILADLQTAAEDAGRLFPLSLGAEGSCMIGGNLSTNAGGVGVLRYGNARDLALGLEVVLPDGQLWDGLRGLRKDNTGYDLKHLFIGAEGTLGVITAAVLKLFPRPGAQETALVAVPRLGDVMGLLADARDASGDAVTAFELMPAIGIDLVLKHFPDMTAPMSGKTQWYVLIELSAGKIGASESEGALRLCLEGFLEKAFAAGTVSDAVIAASQAQASELWRFREILPESQTREGGSIKHDVSVPVSAIADFITQASQRVAVEMEGVRIFPFGHIGDGNIHFNLSQPPGMEKSDFLGHWRQFNRLVHDLAMEMGGSFSAEHGIGQLKRDELTHYRSGIELDLMRRIKQMLDPDGIMNPGKLL
ncbi:MAG: FAD-binding oxidoreductase [Alphaproteobacteria bacterium]